MAWWDPFNTLLRMSCPACGTFSLFFDRTGPTPKFHCHTCGVQGVSVLQRYFDLWLNSQPNAVSDPLKLSIHQQPFRPEDL